MNPYQSPTAVSPKTLGSRRAYLYAPVAVCLALLLALKLFSWTEHAVQAYIKTNDNLPWLQTISHVYSWIV